MKRPLQSIGTVMRGSQTIIPRTLMEATTRTTNGCTRNNKESVICTINNVSSIRHYVGLSTSIFDKKFENHTFHYYDDENTIKMCQRSSSSSSSPVSSSVSASSSSSSSTSSLDVESAWLQTTNRLLETEKGSLTPQMWNEAHKAILFWSNGPYQDKIISLSFKLLDRLCDEEEHILRDDKQNKHHNDRVVAPVAVSPHFNTNLLNLVVNHWRKGIISLTESSSMMNNTSTSSEQNKNNNNCRQHSYWIPSIMVNKIHQYHHRESTCLKPDIQTYSMIIDSVSRLLVNNDQKSMKEYVMLSDSILDWTIQQSTKYPHLQPNVVIFSSVIKSWVKSGLREANDRVKQLLQQMKDLHQKHPTWNVAPNQITYTTIIDLLAKNGQVTAVEETMKEMYEEYRRQNNEDLKPTISTFNGYLVALAKVGAADKAEAVLNEMNDFYDAGELDSKPDVISYSTVLDCFARTKQIRGAAERAEKILRRMNRMGISPNTVSYNAVINAYAKAGNAEMAESLLQEILHKCFVEGDTDVRPTGESFGSVLNAWSKSRSPRAGERGEQLVHRMKDLAQTGELDRPPSLIIYNCVLDCYAKSSTGDSVEKVQKFLKQMKNDKVYPDVYSYNIVLNAMARAHRPQDAENLMQQMYEDGVAPDINTYNTLLSAWNRSKSREASQRVAYIFDMIKEDPTVLPSAITYNTVLNSYSRSGNPNLAEALLEDMINGDGESSVQPTVVSFNTVIAAWSRSRHRDAGQRAERLVMKMQQYNDVKVRPDNITFCTVMDAWIRSGDNNAAERCEAILKLMYDLYGSGNLSERPDVATYNIILRAWAQSSWNPNAPERADAIFNHMVNRSLEGKQNLQPDRPSYDFLIQVWSRSKRQDAALQAETYLQKMIDNSKKKGGKEQYDCEPWSRQFHMVMTIWAKSGDPNNAIVRLDKLLKAMIDQVKIHKNKHARPDERIFGTILMVIGSSSTIENKMEKVDEILKVMKDFQVQPDNFIMNQLNKCYNS